MPISLVLADDHPLVLDGLEQLCRLESDFALLARCEDGETALRAVRAHRPDVLVLDIRMPGKNGLAVLRELSHEKLPTRVVLLTANLGEDDVLEAMRLGVRGVVLKEMAPQLLVRCIRTVHQGGQWIEKRSFGKALDRMLRREAGAREVAAKLTPREVEVVCKVGLGQRNREIAEALNITEGTVKIHLHNIYEKLGLGSRLELSLYAREKGLI
jgi:DNA-binding NarL/FixJ family response regulator